MRYSDTQLYKLDLNTLDSLKLSMSFNEFNKWSVTRLTELIDESVRQKEWMDPEIKHLRNYRIKARDKFFIPKIVKEHTNGFLRN